MMLLAVMIHVIEIVWQRCQILLCSFIMYVLSQLIDAIFAVHIVFLFVFVYLNA